MEYWLIARASAAIDVCVSEGVCKHVPGGCGLTTLSVRAMCACESKLSQEENGRKKDGTSCGLRMHMRMLACMYSCVRLPAHEAFESSSLIYKDNRHELHVLCA